MKRIICMFIFLYSFAAAMAQIGVLQIRGVTAGGILWSGASSGTVAVSAAGTTGQVLVSGGTGAPTWSDTPSLATMTLSSLTSGRVPVAGASGLLADDADLTFATDTLSATKVLAATSLSSPSLISTAAVTITPASGSGVAISLATTGDFCVNTTHLCVDTSTGNVGIGLTAPSEALHLKRTSATSRIQITTTGAGNFSAGAYFETDDGNLALVSYDDGADGLASYLGESVIQASGSNLLLVAMDANADIEFYAGNRVAPKMLFEGTNGYLGVGTAVPNSKLHLEGSGAWIVQDEQDTDVTSTELDANDSVSVYNKSNKFVIAYNNAGTITYISIPLDGSSTTWTHNTTAP